MKTVILDTNFLLIPHQFRINIVEELEKLIEGPHELVLSTAIKQELNAIARNRGKNGIAARVALQGIERHQMRIIETDANNADEWIIHYCEQNPGTIVCTNDVLLRRELKKAGARLIVMRTRTKIFWA